MSRLYSTGGHALVVANWDRITLGALDLDLFGREFAKAMLPAFLFGSQVRDRYTGTLMLREYGFVITESTSVEVSLIGSLCAAGGPELIAVGGLLVGLLHLAMVRTIGRFRGRAWAAPFAGCMFSIGMVVYPLDLIQLARSYFWAVLYVGFVMRLAILVQRLVLVSAPRRLTLPRPQPEIVDESVTPSFSMVASQP